MSGSASRTISCEKDMVNKLLCGIQVLENEIMKPMVQRKLREVNVNRAQCVELVTEYQAGLDVISKQLYRLVGMVDYSCSPYVQQSIRYADDERHNQFWLCLHPLAEVGRCLEAGAIYISSCADPEPHRALLKLNPLARRPQTSLAGNRSFSLTSSFLLQEFLFYLDVVLVGIQYLCERIQGCDMGTGNPLDPTLEWCAESCSLAVVDLKHRWSRPEQHSLLQASSAERLADEDAAYLRGQLKVAATKTKFTRRKAGLAQHLMQLQESESTTADSLPSKFEVNCRDVKEGTCLGSGSSGYVVACKWLGEDVVVKFVKGALEAPKNRENFEKEVSILASLQHPNTVRIFGFGYKEHTGHGFIVMEKMEATLSSLIRKSKNGTPVPTPFPLDINFGVLLQITEGMCYLRERNVMHRDLKPENILINRPDFKSEPLERFYHVKLGDFGASKFQLNSHYVTPQVGTLAYMAPEILATIKGDEFDSETYQGYTWKADVYSFGILCSEILTGKRPFGYINQSSALLAAIRRGERPPLLDSTPQSLKSLIEDCWNTDPELRPDVWVIRERLWKCRAECMPLFQFLKHSNLTPPSSWQGFFTRLDRLQQKALSKSRRLSFWKDSMSTLSRFIPRYYIPVKTPFTTRKEFGKEARETQWAHAQRTLHGLSRKVSAEERGLGELAELARRRAEIARLREVNTLKGHVESVVRLKNLDEVAGMYYTV